jgi:hypothetical protein
MIPSAGWPVRPEVPSLLTPWAAMPLLAQFLAALQACSATTLAFAADLIALRRTTRPDWATGSIPVAFSCRNGSGPLPDRI